MGAGSEIFVQNNSDNNPHIRYSRAERTATADFKAWFGGSKVVDAAGKPLVGSGPGG